MVAFLLCFVVLVATNTYEPNYRSLVRSLFHAVSLGTTCGLHSTVFAAWPLFLPVLLMVIALVGGCAASTCGGMKVIRVLLLQKAMTRELHSLVHPQAITGMKIGSHTVPEHILRAVWAFIAAFLGVFVVLLMLLLANGLDLETAFGALSATLSNAGASIGGVAINYDGLSDPTKWILILSMFLGRLEIFTLLVLLTPDFWQK